MIDQDEAFDRLLAALMDRNVGNDISTRVFIEAMDEAGLILAPGDQAETIKMLDEMDAATE